MKDLPTAHYEQILRYAQDDSNNIHMSRRKIRAAYRQVFGKISDLIETALH